MKRIILYFGLIILLCSALISQDKPSSGLYLNSPTGKFEISYPLGFGSFKKSVNSKGKEEDAKLIMFTMENERGACLVSYNEYSSELFEQKSIDQMLEDALGGYLQNNAKLISSKDITLGNYKGKSAKMMSKDKDGAFYERFDVYVIKPRLYQVAFVGYKKDEMDKPDILKYFKSFKPVFDNAKEQGYYLNDEEEGFEILLPPGYTKPSKEKKPIKTDYGDIQMAMFSGETQEGMCMIAVNEYPEKLFEDKSVEQILNDALSGAVEEGKTKVISKNEYYIDDLQGLQFTSSSVSGKTKIYSKYQYIINKPKLYQVIFMTYKPEDLEKNDIKDYFNSLRIK